MAEFFEHTPTDTGMCFVAVTHQHPDHTSLLPELLARKTRMRVREIVDGARAEPNSVYLTPPGGNVAILGDVFQLMQPAHPPYIRLPIDYFFRSLADNQQHQAIGIVLSGTGTDGTVGAKAIKGVSGMVMAQDPATAKYAGMPEQRHRRPAWSTTCCRPTSSPRNWSNTSPVPTWRRPRRRRRCRRGEACPNPCKKIYILLRSRTGHDFSAYKANTIRRRIERRMNVHQIDSADRYVRFLDEKPHEIDLLFKELLIGVTSFFRDPEAFDVAARKRPCPSCSPRSPSTNRSASGSPAARPAKRPIPSRSCCASAEACRL